LPLFNSVQQFTCDILGKVITIFHQSSVGVNSSSRQRPLRSFRLRILSKSHPLLPIIHHPHYILSAQAGFSANRKEKVGWCNMLAILWLRGAFESGNVQFLLDRPCRVNSCIVHMNQSQGFASFFGIWLHFLSEWTRHFFRGEC
jgi:hypothetical protein